MNVTGSLLPPAGSGQLEAARRQFHAELLAYESSRRYRPGWSTRCYFDRFGCGPPREWLNDPPAPYISPGTFAWVRARAAAFAQSRARRERR